jgi:acetyl esterase
MPNPVDLEPQAKAVVAANAAPPYLFELGPDQGRRTIDELQSGPVKKLTVDIEDTTVPGGPSGQVSVRILRPQGARRPLAVIVYLHGAGWVFGNHHTHDRLIRELAVGNMSAAVALLAKQRGGPAFRQQVLFYPVTDANFDTESYHQFATGYYLRRDGMQWYWDQYTTDPAQRAEPTASPLRASLEQLAGLPPTPSSTTSSCSTPSRTPTPPGAPSPWPPTPCERCCPTRPEAPRLRAFRP